MAAAPLSGLLANTLQYLNAHPTQNMYGRELFGDVLPHIAISRTKDELVDTSVIQLTNTLLPVGEGYTLNKTYDVLQKAIQPVTTQAATQWSHFGKSVALYAMLGVIPVANGFIRNWVTAKRTGSDKFIEMVGEAQKTTSSQKQQEVQQKIKKYEKRIAQLWGGGAVASAGLFALTQLPIKQNWVFGKGIKTIADYIGLQGGKFENFPKPVKSAFGTIPLAPILVWGLPIYTGLFSASRDQFEFKELVLRFAAFLSSFFILPKLAKDAMMKWTPNLMKRAFGNAENAAIVAEFVTTSALFAVVPPLINIYLTHQRAQKAKLKETALPITKAASPMVPQFTLAPPNHYQPFQTFITPPKEQSLPY